MSTNERARVLAAEQAAQWLVKMEDPATPQAERSEFAAWLQFSPANVEEYLNARATWEALSGESMEALPSREVLLRELQTSSSPAVVVLGKAGVPVSPAPARRPRWFATAAAIALLLTGGAAYWVTRPMNPDHARYITSIGQQSSHTLPDGSTLILNTNSRIRLDWSEQFRDIYLDRGEAVFEVAHDTSRPFRVWTGETMVRAVGTRFNVYREQESVTVTVLEGRVEVTTDRQPDLKPVSIGAGEQARVAKQAAVSTKRLEQPQKVVAWQARRLEFEGTPLSQVIAEFNRYSTVALVLEDATLANKRIDGAFDAADRDSLVAFLEAFEDVKVEKRAGEVLIRSR